ncbi:MAG: molybdopterin-binding protein [Paracoccaceae bacterium]|nr:molybdopterin-binding protein [Paracoccaceae bacterium]
MQPPRLKNDCFALPPGVEWTPVDDALALLRERLGPVVASETVPLEQAAGRILAADTHARRANPPMANSAVDGYGFAADSIGQGPQSLPLMQERSAAGHAYTGEVPPGHAIRILTGAVVPRGVDTIIMQEDVRVEGDRLLFEGGLKKGANLRAAGEDVQAGAPLLPAGRRLSPHDLGVLAATGCGMVEVWRPLRVGVLSTGDEIHPVGSDIADEHIYDANRPMLLAMLARWGVQAVDLGHARDERDLLRDVLDDAADKVDAILTSGGASAGDEDHLSALLNAEGHVHSWRIAIKPGRPLALGQWKGVPLFGLPGNPVAAYLCSLIFARPALGLLAGASWQVPRGFALPAAFSKRKKPGRREYLRARLNEDGAVEVFHSEGSGRITGLSWAEGLVELGDEGREITPGDPVTYYPFSAFGL